MADRKCKNATYSYGDGGHCSKPNYILDLLESPATFHLELSGTRAAELESQTTGVERKGYTSSPSRSENRIRDNLAI